MFVPKWLVPATERLQHRVGPSSLRPLSRAGGVATGLSGFSVPNEVGLSRAGGVATGLSGFSVPNEVGLTPVTVRQVQDVLICFGCCLQQV